MQSRDHHHIANAEQLPRRFSSLTLHQHVRSLFPDSRTSCKCDRAQVAFWLLSLGVTRATFATLCP